MRHPVGLPLLGVGVLRLLGDQDRVGGFYSLYEQFQDSFVVGVHIIFFVPIG